MLFTNLKVDLGLTTRTCMYLHVRAFDVQSRQSLPRMTSQREIGGVTPNNFIYFFKHINRYKRILKK